MCWSEEGVDRCSERLISQHLGPIYKHSLFFRAITSLKKRLSETTVREGIHRLLCKLHFMHKCIIGCIDEQVDNFIRY